MNRSPVADLLLTLARWPLVNRLYRSAVRWRFRRLQRIRSGRPVLERVAGYPILVLPEVLNPRLFYSGEFLAKALNDVPLPPEARVLDMGTGTGIIAVAAAHRGAQVVAVDINPEAVRAAQVNTLLNGVEAAIDVREGDLFAPVERERFDVVIFNPPYLAGEPRSLFERALYGAEVVERFGVGLADHLNPGGYGLLLLSSMADEDGFLRCLRKQGWTVTVEVTAQLPLERLTLYRLSREE